jgi:ABC-type dipeptide/oligopeptide/nickel transport system permease subunit
LSAPSATAAASNVAVAPAMPDVLPPIKVRRGLSGFIYRHPTIAFGTALLLAMLLIAVLAPYLATVDPTALSPAKRTRNPSPEFWFGTDMFGRDVYSRVMYGARVSLTVIMAEGRALWQVKPFIVFFPAVFLSLTVLAVNLLGDGLRDILDPRMAKRL